MAPVRGLLLLVMLAGCDGIFDIVGVDSVGGVDGGESPGLCASTQLRWTFDVDGAEPCDGKFGAVSQHDGALYVTTDGSVSAGGCTVYTPIAFTANGVYTHVTEYFTPPSTYTTLKVRSNSDTQVPFDATLSFEGGRLILLTGGVEKGYIAAMPGWIRLRQLDGGSDIIGEYSADASTWTMVGRFTAALLPSTFAVDVTAGVNDMTTPATAAYDELGICN